MVRIWSCVALSVVLAFAGCSPAPGVQRYDMLLAQANDGLNVLTPGAPPPPPSIPPGPPIGPTTPPPAAPKEPERKRSPLAPLMYYIPNRLKDIFDIVSFGIALPFPPYLFPSTVHANVHATRALQLGAGNTHGVFIGKSYDYDFAWRFEHDEFSILPFTACKLGIESDHDSELERLGMLFPGDEPFEQGEMDYWAIGAHAGLLVTAVQVDIHPIEVLDAVFGLIFIDIMGDDL